MAKRNRHKNRTKRRIVKATVGFLSLCPTGANTIRTMYKSGNGQENVDLSIISKDMTEQGEITCVVYAPDMTDYQGDIASEEVIKEFAYDFAKNGNGIDIRHNEQALDSGQIFVAQSTIIQKDDPRFSDMKDYEGNSVDVTGGWGVVLKVEDEELRKLYRSGEWGGISMGGMMVVKDAQEESLAKILKDFILKISKTKNLTGTQKLETDMDLTKQNLEDIAKAVVVATKESDKAKDSEAEKLAKEKLEKDKLAKEKADSEKKLGLKYTEPVLKDNPTEEDRARHLKDLTMYDLSKTVDSTDSVAVFKFQEKCREIANSDNLPETLSKQKGSSFESFYKTNQETSEVSTTFGKASDDPIGDAILADMAKEEKAELKLSA